MIFHFLISNERGDILFSKFFRETDPVEQENWLKTLSLVTESEWNTQLKGHRVAMHK